MASNNAHVFISYSRRNIEFAKRLFAELNKSKRDVWVDWEDIPRASDWMQEIYSGIDNSDTFIFLVSEYSLISEICNQELNYALKQNKRVIPLIVQQVEDDVFQRVDSQWKSTNWYPIAHKNWDALKHLNWLFFDDPTKYDTEFLALLETIDQDLFHIKTHTRLLVRAREWAQSNKNASSLLAGDDIISAEHWLQSYLNKDPLPTELHQEYILSSRQKENERIAYEATLQSRARQRLQILVASFVLIILAMIFGLLPITNTTLHNQLGADTDERLLEAAISFEQLIVEDLSLAEISANSVANFIDTQLASTNTSNDAISSELDAIRNEFGLQELSFYSPNFNAGDSATYYIGPQINHNQRVQSERENLILSAIESEAVVSGVIIGSPESQIAAAVPIFNLNANNNWTLLGVALTAYHLNDEYIEGIAEILNVEAVLVNLERRVVASTLAEPAPEFQNRLDDYGTRYNNLFSDTEQVYIDYENVDGNVLRMVSSAFVVDGEVQGYLFVARSFDAVINLQNQIANTFFLFSGGILLVIVILLVVLVGIPALRNRSKST